MSNNNNQAYSRHHFVQKAYLDKFADDGRIDVINRQYGTVRTHQKTKDVANERGLYTAIKDDGEKDGSLEGAFAAEIEGPAIKIINNMTSVFPYVPHGIERSLIAYYMAFQYLRTPEAKRRFQTDAGRFAAIELFNFSNKPDEIKKYLESKGKDSSDEAIEKHRKMILESIKGGEIVPKGNMWFQMITDGMNDIAPILVERYHWHLYYYDKPTFVTSDHPVVMRKINNDHLGTGFANADEVMFPLSKNYALILSVDPSLPEDVYFEPAPEAAEMLNYFVTQDSYLEIYTPPSLTSEYSGKALGKRPIITMSGGLPKEIDFLSQYAGVLKRERPHRH